MWEFLGYVILVLIIIILTLGLFIRFANVSVIGLNWFWARVIPFIKNIGASKPAV